LVISLVQATKAAMTERRSAPAFIATLHTLLFVIGTLGFALYQEIMKTTQFVYSSMGAMATILSFGLLMRATCKAYQTNGMWIVMNFCVV
jgi:uncharacterized BrkB/YihY/UPF0761 family membrane protein